MHPHAHGFGAPGHGLGDVAKAHQAQSLRAQLAAQGRGATGPIGPALLAQILVGACQWHMAHQQCRDHVFGDGVFMTKAIGQGALRGQERGVDRIGARGRGMEQPGFDGLGHVGVELDADHHIGALVVFAFTGLVKRIAQVQHLVFGGDQGFKALAEIGRVLAVEDDFQRGGAHVVSRIGVGD
jgi:hypothetical protein